ncbi:hypothetical protein RDI58_022385 [Solanum bulbocastanum]|uniref:RNase H type-1 domain-containing protein n=1 Tax=Solanum bulbocastanum TaxID=147425 RepID=A0AAN8TAI9_SOLBU
MEAETMAIWKALQYCINHGFSNIQLETDSLSLKLIIRSTWKVPWEITEKIEEIKETMNRLNVQIEHTFREANQLANHITNTAISQAELQQFHSFNQLSSMGRRILNTDRRGIPTIRI